MVEIRIAKKLGTANDVVAGELKRRYSARGILALNLMGSPGAGKTSVLERLAGALGGRPAAVIEGDLETAKDAERIEKAGLASVQITTGRACHLDAGMVRDGLEALSGPPLDLLFIENVGNLVCPAGFDLGEDLRLLVASTAEGDDKAAKYPPMFARADLLVVNKVDLAPHIDFKMDRFLSDARRIRPDVEVFPTSCRTGEGIDALAARIEKAYLDKFPPQP